MNKKIRIPFKVRRYRGLLGKIGDKKYPLGFTPVPINVFMANSDENDLDEKACPNISSGNA
jgi:hypothetical protein